MRSSSLWYEASIVGAAALIWIAACGGDEPAPPASAGSGGTAGNGGGSAGSSGEAAGGDAGAGGGGGVGAGAVTSPDGGTQSIVTGGFGNGPGTIPPDYESVCSPTMTVGVGSKLSVSTAGDDLFGAVTPDELTIAWTTVSGDVVTLHHASRASTAEDFGAPFEMPIAAAPDAVALSPDGLRVAFVNVDRRGFSAAIRASRDVAFGAASADEFSLLDAANLMLPEVELYGDPVIGSGVYFYYSRFGGNSSSTLYGASRFVDFDPWSPGTPLEATSELLALATDRFRPVGASVDGYTLFLRDDGSSSTVAAFVNPESGVLGSWVALGDLRGGGPNADCSRLYYSAMDTSLDLYVTTLE